jgi:hypothetical protein
MHDLVSLSNFSYVPSQYTILVNAHLHQVPLSLPQRNALSQPQIHSTRHVKVHAYKTNALISTYVRLGGMLKPKHQNPTHTKLRNPTHTHVPLTDSFFFHNKKNGLPEPSRAATHDFTLANKLGVEFGAVEREVNVKVDAVKSALGRVHAFKVFFEVLS